MKTILPEIKKQIFAQYLFFQRSIFDTELGKYKSIIELNKISNISDEDAIELSNILKISLLTDTDMRLPISEIKKIILYYINDFARRSFSDSIKIYQYLQSKGYALPYMDYSVEDLVELGVYKLK